MSNASTKKSTKLFVNGVLVLTIFNVLEKIIGLVYKIPMLSLLGEEGMGYFNAAYAIYTWFFMISTAGLPVAMSLMISRSRARGNFNQVKKIMRIGFFTFLVVGIVGMTVLFAGSDFFSASVQKQPNCKYCIMAIAPTLFFVCLSSAFRGYFQGHQIMWPTGVSQFIESLGKLIFGILFADLAVKSGQDLPHVAAAAVFGLTVAVFCGMLFIWAAKLLYKTASVNAEYELPNSYTMPTEKTRTLLRELAVIAIPVTLSSSVMSLANLIDSAVVSRQLQAIGFTAKAAAGLYGGYTTVAVSLFNLPPVLVYPIGYSLVPMLTAMLAQKDEDSAQRAMRSSLKTAAVIALPCTVGMAALASPIISLIFSDKAVDYFSANDYVLMGKGDTLTRTTVVAPLLALLAVSSFLVCMLAITNSVLQAHKKQQYPLYSMLVGAVCKVFASLVLIGNPKIGIYGAPISTDICYIIVVAMNFYFCARHADFRPSIRKVFVKPLIAAALCGVSAIGAYALLANRLGTSRLVTLAAIAVAGVVYIVAILLLRALEKEDFEFIPMGQKLCRLLTRLHLVK